MNKDVLIKFISIQLKTNVHTLDENGNIKNTICELVDFTDPYLAFLPLDNLYNIFQKQTIPLIYSYDIIHYAFIRSTTETYLLGPVRLSPSTVFYTTIQADDAIDLNWYARLHTSMLDTFIDYIYLLTNIEANVTITKEDILSSNLAMKDLHVSLQKRYANLLFQNNEHSKHHNPYNQELREQASIEQGDVKALKQTIAENYTGEIGTLSKDTLRNVQNIGIVLTTLASRSAIRGGVSPELAYSLSDSYIQQIEEISNPTHLSRFIRNMEIHYTTLVKDIKERDKKNKTNRTKNIPIEQCKDYIFSHLHDRITVDVLAHELGYNRDYLSHLFKTETGIGISEYILKEKINRAKNLLIYTHYSYSEIASYLGFSSQSHFGQVFKKYIGETPHKFRQREKADNFYG